MKPGPLTLTGGIFQVFGSLIILTPGTILGLIMHIPILPIIYISLGIIGITNSILIIYLGWNITTGKLYGKRIGILLIILAIIGIFTNLAGLIIGFILVTIDGILLIRGRLVG